MADVFHQQLGIKLKWLFRCFKSFILIHSNLNKRSRKKVSDKSSEVDFTSPLRKAAS